MIGVLTSSDRLSYRGVQEGEGLVFNGRALASVLI